MTAGCHTPLACHTRKTSRVCSPRNLIGCGSLIGIVEGWFMLTLANGPLLPHLVHQSTTVAQSAWVAATVGCILCKRRRHFTDCLSAHVQASVRVWPDGLPASLTKLSLSLGEFPDRNDEHEPPWVRD